MFAYVELGDSSGGVFRIRGRVGQLRSSGVSLQKVPRRYLVLHYCLCLFDRSQDRTARRERMDRHCRMHCRTWRRDLDSAYLV